MTLKARFVIIIGVLIKKRIRSYREQSLCFISSPFKEGFVHRVNIRRFLDTDNNIHCTCKCIMGECPFIACYPDKFKTTFHGLFYTIFV